MGSCEEAEMNGIKRWLWMWRLQRWEKSTSVVFMCDRYTARRLWDVVKNSPATLCDIAGVAEIYGSMAKYGYRVKDFAKLATSLLDGEYEPG